MPCYQEEAHGLPILRVLALRWAKTIFHSRDSASLFLPLASGICPGTESGMCVPQHDLRGSSDVQEFPAFAWTETVPVLADSRGTKDEGTKQCTGCCPYLPHRGFFGDLLCKNCNNTGHKPGCQARR